MEAIGDSGLALAMIAAVFLGIAGVRWVIQSDPVVRQRGMLMIGAALVLVANVLIWTV